MAEQALITVWASLARYHAEIVLVGGLAVHYLTRPDPTGGLPGAVTMDVDLGVALAATGGQYGTIKSDLSGLGFKPEGSRLVRRGEDFNLYLDFLTEAPPATGGTRRVDDVTAGVFPGINRALERRRIVAVRGPDIYGLERECQLAVADIGPLLVLKLNAFGGPSGRRLPKDAYDILLAVTQFVEGPAAAVVAFQAEANAGNPAYPWALNTLRQDFSQANQDGPIRAAAFVGANGGRRERIRQDVATVGQLLLGG